MDRSASIANIAAALATARSTFPAIVKSKTVEVKTDKGRYTFAYAPLDEILSAVTPALTAHGLTIIQNVGDTVQTMLMHSSGEWISSSEMTPRPMGGGMQAIGGAVMYCRRYQLSALLNIAPEDDDDGARADQVIPKAVPARAGSAPITPTSGALDAVADPERRAFVEQTAAIVIAYFDADDIDGALAAKTAAKLDADETVALWSLLKPYSKQRNAMKALALANKSAQASANA